MSKIKNPQSKKLLSLHRDRRNVYGENAKSSRKNIAKGKQRRHMDERRGAKQLLRAIHQTSDEDAASRIELQVRSAIADSRHRGFKKIPDKPLGEVLERKKSRRLTSAKTFGRVKL